MEIWQAYSVEQTVYFESQTDRVLLYVEFTAVIVLKYGGHLVPRLHCETAQFWARYMGIIPMVFTLIRGTRKTTLNCMSALSVCLVPNVHCT